MHSFVYESLPVRVVFGSGTADGVAEEVERLGCRRAVLVTTPGRAAMADRVAASLGDRLAGRLACARMHTPVEVTGRALVEVAASGADCTVAVGGGSAIGLSKAIALETGLPQIVLPTTYAGSEMTPIVGQTRDGVKTTQKAASVQPRVVIYDVDLTVGLPVPLSVVSGLNAVAHGVEALYARDANPLVSIAAEDGVRALAAGLPEIARRPSDREARAGALYGAWLCGLCLGSVGMALHHKLCHVLGGTFDLPHAETHAVVLPHAFAWNAPAVPDAAKRLARALAVDDPVRGLWELCRRLGAPASLEAIGMPREGIARAVELAARDPYWNPRPVNAEGIRDLLARAWAGEPPS